MASWAPQSGADVTRLGKALARGKGVRRLKIDGTDGLDRMLASDAEFLEGLRRNTSVRMLELGNCTFSAEIMKAFEGRVDGLSVIILDRCDLGDDGGRALADSLGKIEGWSRSFKNYRGERCVGVKQIRFRRMGMTGDALDALVLSMRKLEDLEEIAIVDCNIANTIALSNMLEDPKCNLRKLSLQNISITGNSLILLADAIAKNVRLEHMYLVSDSCDDRVLAAFSMALCDASSPNATFLSNHSMRYFVCSSSNEETIWPDNLERMLQRGLELNRSANDTRDIAIKKILLHHERLDMTSCFEWELKLLPHVIAWFEQAGKCVENNDNSLSPRKLDAIYQFTRAMPLTTVAKAECWETQWEMAKRKRFGVTW
eukprot:CAMPEP_0181140538 /NCGR_PEP_ID=MMETSP1071-20121207/35356_1 /TAXON_ID=35127 /ORGANISM="Thalassiosira sp., Strain NH16" /LENGTH=371 /DNA_ID=CAMNT_0023227493 /DNA_START=239 /DNA_END=1351 /DNA_ORIENTATION=-